MIEKEITMFSKEGEASVAEENIQARNEAKEAIGKISREKLPLSQEKWRREAVLALGLFIASTRESLAGEMRQSYSAWQGITPSVEPLLKDKSLNGALNRAMYTKEAKKKANKI